MWESQLLNLADGEVKIEWSRWDRGAAGGVMVAALGGVSAELTLNTGARQPPYTGSQCSAQRRRLQI
jgi:hypothetical protein